MSRALIALLPFVCALAVFALAQPANEKGSMEGIVTNSVTGDPIARAIVTIAPLRNATGRNKAALTDASGKFVFEELEPGTYQLQAGRNGFAPYSSWGEAPSVRFDGLKVLRGERTKNVGVKLVPEGAISGRVFDSNGDPMPDVQLEARGLRGGGNSSTDEHGCFRIGGLVPGAYWIRARASEQPMPPEIRTDGSEDLHHDPTYFPSAAKQSLASRVTVAPGTETQGIEIRMLRGPILRVSGRVKGIPPGTQQLTIAVTERSPAGTVSSGSFGVVTQDGSFVVWRISPGVHHLSVQGSAPDGQQLRTAQVRVAVEGTNVDDVELFVTAPFDVIGHVEFEESQSRARSSQPPSSRQEIALRAAMYQTGSYQTEIGAGGAFRFKQVPPGRYGVVVPNGPAYVKSMRLGDIEIEGPILDLPRGTNGAELTVRLATEMGAIAGVVDRAGKPLEGVTVEAIDVEEELRAGRVLHKTKADGTFSIAVTPGKYRLVLNGEDPEEGDVIEVRAGDKITRNLTAPDPVKQE